jgi:SAM-dependent methyltransferase
MDPLAGTNWSDPGTVSGFARSAPNEVLMRFARADAVRRPAGRALDLGCGAGRNAVPLAASGWHVLGLDLSWPMLVAASARGAEAGLRDRLGWVLAPMDRLPVADRSVDLVIAHGIWNLAPSAELFRRAVAEAGRVARPGAGLFVFTFSRNTLPADIEAVNGQPFVYTQFSGAPQCFLTDSQLVEEMARAGFVPDPAVPMSEYNRRPGAVAAVVGPPVIYEAAFRLG